jgi:hypothetical protein
METKILQHKIQYNLIDEDSNAKEVELTEADIEHIEKMIKEGYVEGELFSSRMIDEKYVEYSGWWNIKKCVCHKCDCGF